jgi:hypothetical protein
MLTDFQSVASVNRVGVRVMGSSEFGQMLPQRHAVPSLRRAKLPELPAETATQLVLVPI